mmetsp:Transcript_7662/g.11479  ORF Transcript_7662/g.11479 Transcript_7662/m.11479 type:complete len:259 (-) Transcript_7662:27-803(-)
MCQPLLPQSTQLSPIYVGDTHDVIHLEHVVVQRLSQGLDTSQMIRASLTNQTSRSPHGQPSIRNLLRLKPRGLLGIALQVSQRIQSKITGRPIPALPSARRGNSRHGLDEGNHDKSGGDVLRVRVPNLPESIGLTLQRGGFASGGGSEEFDLNEAGDGEHGNAAVLDFLFPEVVECFCVGICEESEGVEEAKGCLNTECLRVIHRGDSEEILLSRSDTQSRGGLGDGGGSESGGGASGGGEDGKLHHGWRVIFDRRVL